MKTNGLIVLLYSFVIFFISSCNVINPDEGIPSFIAIDSLIFQGEITDSHNITEVWVFDGGTMLGAYDLPAEIPILKTGDVELTFLAGIKNNGVSTTRIIYPFFTNYKEVVNLVSGEKTPVTPSFTYVDNVDFPDEAIATYETAGFNYGETINSVAQIALTQNENEIFPDGGTGSGYIRLDEEDFYWQGQSLSNMVLPVNEFGFIEFNYKCTNAFAVGLIANAGSTTFEDIEVVMSPTTDSNGVPQWKKIYIDIGATITNNSFASSYNVLFEAFLQSNLDVGEIWLDNIYVVHFD